jgi:hypothetical protein
MRQMPPEALSIRANLLQRHADKAQEPGQADDFLVKPLDTPVPTCCARSRLCGCGPHGYC